MEKTGVKYVRDAEHRFSWTGALRNPRLRESQGALLGRGMAGEG